LLLWELRTDPVPVSLAVPVSMTDAQKKIKSMRNENKNAETAVAAKESKQNSQ